MLVEVSEKIRLFFANMSLASPGPSQYNPDGLKPRWGTLIMPGKKGNKFMTNMTILENKTIWKISIDFQHICFRDPLKSMFQQVTNIPNLGGVGVPSFFPYHYHCSISGEAASPFEALGIAKIPHGRPPQHRAPTC